MAIRIKDIIAIVIIAALGYFLVIQKRQIIRQETFVKAQKVQVDTWTDKFEQSNAKAERIEGDNRTIRELYQMQTDSIETLSKQLKKKEVISYQRVDAVATNHIEAEVDTVGGHVQFNFENEHIKINGRLAETFTIDIEQIIPIHLMTYKERVGLFKKTTYVHAVTTNPNVTLTGVSSIAVKNKIKRYGIGVQFGVSYFGEAGFRPYIGVGISYNLIRF